MVDFIFKIKPPAGAKFNAVNYNAKKQDKGDAKLIYFRNFGYLQDQPTIKKEEFMEFRKIWANHPEKNAIIGTANHYGEVSYHYKPIK